MLAHEAAAALGMAVHEVVAVVDTADGPVVVTHDGTKTLIRADGSLEFTPPPSKAEADRASLALDDTGTATLSREDAAARLGMAVHEVVSVYAADGGNVVVTHDGHPTLITDGGELVFGTEAIRDRLHLDAPAGEDEDEDGAGGGTGGEGQGDAVPEGTMDDLFAWVGDDKDKAARALEAEKARAKGPRAGVITKLESMVGQA